MLVAEKNRLTSPSNEFMKKTIKDTIKFLEETINQINETVNSKIKENKKLLKELKSNFKKEQKLDLRNIKNIDKVVSDTAKEKMRSLFVIHHCMKEAAVDCRLNKNANQTDDEDENEIQCM